MSDNPPTDPQQTPPQATPQPNEQDEKKRFFTWLDEWLSSDSAATGSGNQPTPTTPPTQQTATPPAVQAPQPSSPAISGDLRSVVSSVLDERDRASSTDTRIKQLEDKIKDLEGKLGAQKVRAWFSPLIG